MDKKSYIQGNKAAWSSLLSECLKHLGYDIPIGIEWILERESAISQLRELCEKFGDNDWPDSLYLSDIIEKHLADHLYESDRGSQNNG